MKRRWTKIGLTLAAVIVFTAGSPNSTIPIDDFDDGDAVGWDQMDLTGGLGTFDASSGTYVIESSEPIPLDDPSGGTIESHWEASEGQPRFANGTLRGTFRANTEGTSVAFTIRDDDDAETAYDFCGSSGFGAFYIDRVDFGATPPINIIAMADPDEAPFVVGVTYNVEAGFVGHRLWMKVWPVGEPEPTGPTLSVTDQGLGPVSGTALAVDVFFDAAPLGEAGVDEVRVSGTFDDITFTPGAKR
jgi:hypothetical protein